MESERIVLKIPVNMTLEELATYCKVSSGSSAMETLEESLPLINEYAAPLAIIKWASVDEVKGDCTVIDGVSFISKVVSEKLRAVNRVYLSVITEADSLQRCEDLSDDPFFDFYKGAVLGSAVRYVVDYMRDVLRYDGSSMLNPGSLPDWPISNNAALLGLIGNAGEISVRMSPSGYMLPWNTTSHIHFPGEGYENCSLCKRYDCIRRRAAFNKGEYVRIFGMEP